MQKVRKTEQLQIRVSRSEKRAIKRHAEKAGMRMSEWILSRVLPSSQATFRSLIEEIASSAQPSYPFAELLEFFDLLSVEAFESAVSNAPAADLDRYWLNYLAATVEQASVEKGVAAPGWTRDIAPLDAPVFGSNLKSLRLHLLVASPPPFAARNIFIDSAVGDRV